MAHASIMTFNDPNESIRVKSDNGKVYIYWQACTYLALNQAETLQLRDDLSRAIAAYRLDDAHQFVKVTP